MSDKPSLNKTLNDLIKQAETERSHYYVASVLKACKRRIVELEAKAMAQSTVLHEQDKALVELEAERDRLQRELDEARAALIPVPDVMDLNEIQDWFNKYSKSRAAVLEKDNDR